MYAINREQEKLSPVFFLFLFYIVVWWLQLGERWGGGFSGKLRLEAMVAFCLLIATLVDGFRKKPKEKAGFTPFVLALFGVMLLQVVTAWNIDKAWFVFTERVLKYSAMGLFISHFVRTPKQLRWLIFIWMLACLKGMFEGFIGGITGSHVWENQGIMRLHGNGLWSHPNSFAQFALGVIPFCYYLFPVVKRIWIKFGIITLFCFSSYVVVYTGSRTGYLGYVIMITLFFLQASKKIRITLLIIIVVSTPIVVNFIPQSYQERFTSSFTGREKEGNSKGARMKLYREGWYVFTNHPFGVGVGNYPEAGTKYFGYKQEQHCLYTEILTELGIQGFIVFMFLLWKIYSILRLLKNQLQSLFVDAVKPTINPLYLEDINFIYAVIQATMVFFLLRLFLDIFGMDLYGIIWWFVIGIASSIYFITFNVYNSIARE